MFSIIFESFRFLIGVLIGGVLGLTGGGGSLLLPTFTYLFEFPVQLATGYTLILTGATAAVGVVPRIRNQEVDYAAAVCLVLPVLLGTLLVRAWLFELVPDVVLEIAGTPVGKRTLVMFIFAGIVLLSWATMIGLIGSNLKPNPEMRTAHPLRYCALMTICGLAIGILSAFIGAGGGVMLVPLMVIVMGLEMRTVIGTTLLIVAIKSTIGFVGDIWTQGARIDVLFLAKFFGAMGIGVLLGATVAQRVSPSALKIGFAWFLLSIALFVILKELVG